MPSFQKILKSILFGAIFLTPFVPLYITGSLFFPFITGKAFLFRILVEIAFGSWLVLALSNPKYRPQKSSVLIALTTFVGIIALADIFSGHFAKSFWSNFERMEGFVTLLHLLAYFFVLSSFIKTDKIWDRLLNTTLLASLYSAGRGFLQLFGFFQSTQSGSRIDGTFGNASYMAVYMLFHIFIAAYLFSKESTSRGLKWLYGIIIAFESFVLIFTQTRGAILGLVGAAFLTSLLVLLFEKDNKRTKKIAAWVVGLVVVVAALFFVLKDTSVVQNTPPLKRVASISLTERTTSSRFLIWNMALEGFKEKPVLGWGQENFIFVFEKYFHPGMWNQEPWFDRAHNIFFDWLIVGGALGLLAYLSIFVFSLLRLRRTENLSVVQKSLFVGLLAGYFVNNLFVFDNIGSYLMFILVLSFIHFKTNSSEKSEEVIGRPFVYSKALAPIIIVLMIFSLYFFNAKGILAGKSLLQAISPQDSIERNLELYRKALSYNTYGNQEIREQLLSASSAVINRDVPQELKEEFAAFAVEEMQKQIDENPNSARHQVFMGSFFNRLRLYDQAIPYLERALELSPNKQPTYFEFVTNNINSGNTKGAVDFARRAFELDKEFDDARIIYVTALIYDGQFDLARGVLGEKFGDQTIPDPRLASAYFETGQIQDAIIIWQSLVDADPTNIQNRTSLAATLLAAGQRDEAVSEIQKAIEINPGFKEQGDFFIKEIEAGRNP